MATLGEFISEGSATTKGLWHLNGSSADSSGNSNNGTDTNITYSLANGKFGQGAGFNGSTSNILVSSLDNTNFSGGYTFSVWANITALPGTNNYEFFVSFPKNQNGLALLNLSGTQYLTSYYTNSSNKAERIDHAITLSTGTWYNIITTFSGTTLSLYLNGVFLESRQVTTIYSTGPGEYHSYIGAWETGTLPFNGAMDEVIISNTAWSAAKIAKYYSFAKGRFGII